VTPTVFLDRDGTMIHDVGYLSRREDVTWYPWAIDAIRLLNRGGFRVIVVTNQGGIGLGFYDEAFVRALHGELGAHVEAAGGRIDAWYYCPHHPLARVEALRRDCDCRKPQPGMIHQAARDFSIDLARSFVVGDKASDLGLARAVGARGILVRTGYGAAEAGRHAGTVPHAELVADTLLEAASWVLEQQSRALGVGR
jgi:D-glycero-D-manno-heptose 1,7-bisphosphate phosphatase